MKKIIAILAAITIMMNMPVVAYAADEAAAPEETTVESVVDDAAEADVEDTEATEEVPEEANHDDEAMPIDDTLETIPEAELPDPASDATIGGDQSTEEATVDEAAPEGETDAETDSPQTGNASVAALAAVAGIALAAIVVFRKKK